MPAKPSRQRRDPSHAKGATRLGFPRQRLSRWQTDCLLPRGNGRPTGNLDQKTGSEIIDIFENLAGEETIILVTHDPTIASRTERRIKIVDGLIVSGELEL